MWPTLLLSIAALACFVGAATTSTTGVSLVLGTLGMLLALAAVARPLFDTWRSQRPTSAPPPDDVGYARRIPVGPEADRRDEPPRPG